MTRAGRTFAVIQFGPRNHYAVPRILAEAGRLRALYTDMFAGSSGARLLSGIPRKHQPQGLQRLLARTIPDNIPASLIRSSSASAVQQMVFNRVAGQRRKSARVLHRLGIGGHWLSRMAIADSFGSATALYVHPCVSTEAIKDARRRGLFVVLEAISHPYNKRIELEECRRFKVAPPDAEEYIEDNITFFMDEVRDADMIFAASPYVRRGLCECGVAPRNVTVVPYGIDTSSYGISRPVVGRVLYVGSINYLKGVQYLAHAARLLSDKPEYTFRAVGSLERMIARRPEFVGLEYTGAVPRTDMKRQYLCADVLVLPTLSDGFGLVVLEAMASGVPVICTPNCTDLVRDGENGFVVPERDGAAIATRVRQIVENRHLRARMSDAAHLTANLNDLTSYQKRFLGAIEPRAHSCDRQ